MPRFLIGKENQGINYMFLMMNEATHRSWVTRFLVKLQLRFLTPKPMPKKEFKGSMSQVKKGVENPPKIAIVNHPDVKECCLDKEALSKECELFVTLLPYA